MTFNTTTATMEEFAALRKRRACFKLMWDEINVLFHGGMTIPENWRVINLDYSPERYCWVITVCSEDFEPVDDGVHAPMFATLYKVEDGMISISLDLSTPHC